MSVATHSQPIRYPLGLPAGSVRSILAIMIVGLFCLLVLISTADNPIELPVFLIGLVFLVVISLLAAQGRSMGKPGETPPLGLPRWTVRVLILGGLIATFAFKLTQDPEGLQRQIEVTLDGLKNNPLHVLHVFFYLLGGYIVGNLLQTLFGLDPQIIWYQDFKAWVAIVAMVGMLIVILVTLVINPTLSEEYKLRPEDMEIFVGILSAIVSFYFAVRS